MSHFSYYEYIEFGGDKFFTTVLLPQKNGSFPTIIYRSPYLSFLDSKNEEEITEIYLRDYKNWLDRGYAVVIGHCKGQGKSTGEFVPYIHEHEDSRMLRNWIRNQAFYNGELFLLGASYTASLHYCSAPFEDDIKGAVLEVQDSERYNLWYRNGQMRKGHANWHFALYKPKTCLKKDFSIRSFSRLPLKELSKEALGEIAEDFEQMLEASSPSDSFWGTRNGGGEAKGATDNIAFPILFTTGYNDFYVGGMFKMWNKMCENSRKNCAMLVSPYDHGDGYNKEIGIGFENATRGEKFGHTYPIDWCDNIRCGTPLPFEKGVVTYYRAFENKWQSDFYATKTNETEIPLGEGVAELRYDPQNPPGFCDEGTFEQTHKKRDDIISVYTKPFDRDVFIKGQMKAKLTVSSNCPDTSFFVSVYIHKKNGDYRLRHDITSLLYQLESYTENSSVTLNFTFDEHAFLLKKGEALRVDISSTDDNAYVCHTNNKGPYHLQTKTQVAKNKVYLEKSHLILPIEE